MEIPENHIVTLLDEQATRDAILSSFQTHLIQNNNIKHNDAIVIYFAGKRVALRGSGVQWTDWKY